MWEKQRLEEIALQREQMADQRIQREKEDKRFCLDLARGLYGATDITSLIKDATALYNFIK